MRNKDHRFQKVVYKGRWSLTPDRLLRKFAEHFQTMCRVDTLYCEMAPVFHVRPFLFAMRRGTETNLMLALFPLQPQCYTLHYLIRDYCYQMLFFSESNLGQQLKFTE